MWWIIIQLMNRFTLFSKENGTCPNNYASSVVVHWFNGHDTDIIYTMTFSSGIFERYRNIMGCHKCVIYCHQSGVRWFWFLMVEYCIPCAGFDQVIATWNIKTQNAFFQMLNIRQEFSMLAQGYSAYPVEVSKKCGIHPKKHQAQGMHVLSWLPRQGSLVVWLLTMLLHTSGIRVWVSATTLCVEFAWSSYLVRGFFLGTLISPPNRCEWLVCEHTLQWADVPSWVIPTLVSIHSAAGSRSARPRVGQVGTEHGWIDGFSGHTQKALSQHGIVLRTQTDWIYSIYSSLY